MKNILKLFLALSLSLLLVTGCGCEKKKEEVPEEELKVNTNVDIIKDQQVEVFKFENTSLIYEDGNSIFETTVTNESDSVQTLTEFKMHIKNEKGETIETLTGYVGSTIEPKASKIIQSKCIENLTDKAISVEYEIIR